MRYLVFSLAVTALLWPTALRADDSFTVVTYNIRYASPHDGKDVWSERKESVAQFLGDFDIFGLQEVTAGQRDDLDERLGLFESYGLGRDDGKRGGEAAPIYFLRSRFTAQSKGTIWLSESPETIGKKGWDAALPRTMTYLVLLDKQTDKTFLVANTHFDHRGVQARLESGKLIRRWLDQRDIQLPTIVMGDFNCLPDSDPYRALTTNDSPSPLADARTLAKSPVVGPTSTWNGFQQIVPDRIIDHVFVRGPIEIVELETHDPKTSDGRFASDHLPVRVLLRIK
ncbi:MAG: endonuclease/exonuclease/phosphatase family protein [Pirellulaceae bacterium]|nr:endonuclease/exonuclease/phosphatase family protein [Pirellulaceae bacterium]